MQDSRTYTALALAGTIPFIAGAVLPMLCHDSLPHLGPLDQLVSSYGLAIVCFLAGAHWGIYLAGRNRWAPHFLTGKLLVGAADPPTARDMG